MGPLSWIVDDVIFRKSLALTEEGFKLDSQRIEVHSGDSFDPFSLADESGELQTVQVTVDDNIIEVVGMSAVSNTLPKHGRPEERNSRFVNGFGTSQDSQC